ncbi:NAD(P)H-dependent oxidoreductase [Granulicella sibirica]|uniref:NAD(P)H oxidoreductase YRKL n=1 Tax=Granulicella sibirica TaxID=2479048 RepID=A0A4Q0SZE1_9BACT|nr:NAD(P)H-dependent oxidoreductase [Granulicella sibirica]RXH55390.1 NAD(P)H oxidoreductase YRKL [Granulicella sibirica]
MNYLIVYAHPEPKSFSGYLKDRAVESLEAAGHEVIVSDLYAMGWKAVADRDDFPENDPNETLYYSKASREAYAEGKQSSDITEEQRKLLWADAVILQFPLWWYGMPAILKGWFDRVYAFGFAYGRGKHGGGHWGDRFGEGIMKGKRAMVAMMVGGRMAHYGPRGVNGSIDDLLWPIHHGVLYYPGFDVVPPTIFYEVGRVDPSTVEALTEHYLERVLNMADADPIPFIMQNGGDYDDVQVLKSHINPEMRGHALHQHHPAFISNTWLGVSGDYTPRHIPPTSRDIEKP